MGRGVGVGVGRDQTLTLREVGQELIGATNSPLATSLWLQQELASLLTFT